MINFTKDLESYIYQLVEAKVEELVQGKLTQPLPYALPQNAKWSYHEYLTRDQAAEYMQVSVSAIDNYKNMGLITPHRVAGSSRYKMEDIRLLLEKGNINYNIKNRRSR